MIGVLVIIGMLALAVTVRIVAMYRIVGRDRIRRWNDWPS